MALFLRKRLLIILGIVLLLGCNKEQSMPEDVNNEYVAAPDDVIDKQGNIINLDLLDEFVTNVTEGKQGNIRIVKYTTEGDPIIQDLEYDAKEILVTNDPTRDRYGSDQISTISCQSIDQKNTTGELEYQLAQCGSSEKTIDALIVSKRSEN